MNREFEEAKQHLSMALQIFEKLWKSAAAANLRDEGYYLQVLSEIEGTLETVQELEIRKDKPTPSHDELVKMISNFGKKI